MNTPHTPGWSDILNAPMRTEAKWSCDSATGTLYENGVTAGKLTTESGAWLRIVQEANSAPSLLAQRNALRQALQAIVDLASPDLTPPSRVEQTAPAFDQARAALALVKEVGK